MNSRFHRGLALLGIGLLVLCSARPAGAQALPTGPIVLANGQVTVGGDVSLALGPDDIGFFNYTDYEHSSTRLFRSGLTASFRAGDHVIFMGGLRAENVDQVRPYALYVCVRPWTTRAITIQAGRIPPAFGAFARRRYGLDNPLIGYPIAYQYLTSLRADALPADADELLGMRGRGAHLGFSIGNPAFEHGMAIASTSNWDTGVQVHAASRIVEATASMTAGTLSYPKLHDDNSAKRLAGRVVVRPVVGLVLGASASHGPFLGRSALRSAMGEGHAGEFMQTAWGGDAEYSRDYYLVRVETILSEWTIPLGAQAVRTPLHALATSVEGRYKVRPGLYAAARFDHLGFSTIAGSLARDTWDAPVTRVEIGGGYSLQRNLVLKLSFQHNTRDGGAVRTRSLVGGQLQFWF
jgi:hypothetical protein